MRCFYNIVSLFIIATFSFALDASGQEAPPADSSLEDTVFLHSNKIRILTDSVTYLNSEIRRLSNYQDRIEMLNLEEHLVMSEMKSEQTSGRVGKTETEVEKLNTNFDDVSLILSKLSERTFVSAIFMLVGLVLEIVGAILLAGTYLVTQQSDVYTLKATPPLRDLALRDVKLEPRINFLGAIGAILLIIGFVIQFIGTIIVLSFSLLVAVSMIFMVISLIVGIFYYLLGQSVEQTRSEKLRFLFRNFRRNILPSYKLSCDFCSKRLDVEEAQVWWLHEQNTEEFPFLHQAYHWHLGHDSCLNSSGLYDTKRPNNEVIVTLTINKTHLDEFKKSEIDKYNDWWRKYHEYWTKRRNTKSRKSAEQNEFLTIVSRIM